MGGGQARGVGAVRGLAPTSPLNSSSLYSVDLLQPCFCANEFTKKDDDDDDDDDEGSLGRHLSRSLIGQRSRYRNTARLC